jgi:hypothetical protein
MRVLCAWCEKEGKPPLIGEKEPLDDPTESHGLCPEHRVALEAEIEALRKKVDP